MTILNLILDDTIITNCYEFNIFNQKHEFYPKMQWTFGIQANLDAMNQLSWHIIKYSNLWNQELPRTTRNAIK